MDGADDVMRVRAVEPLMAVAPAGALAGDSDNPQSPDTPDASMRLAKGFESGAFKDVFDGVVASAGAGGDPAERGGEKFIEAAAPPAVLSPAAAHDAAPTSVAPAPERRRRRRVCDACPHCDDVCGLPQCVRCAEKAKAIAERDAAGGKRRACDMVRVTRCQVARHNTADDLWLIAHGKVYDVTPFLNKHPGGTRSLLRHAGQDSTVDFDFHSRGAQAAWKGFRIGTVVRCPSEPSTGGCVIS
uniref:Cytochrome b5 heme-binding domain-containing protein n=1 Tax=Bicosoecida sp. CB-2014 TaxID=1486930 RepID=A0A7S1C712_9STRA|mmetsp:Transcript_14371/g.49968  ORF Transcript_14371/g.49968 Transcript_14371/m.49968 type:complete len:243 (+) Transcript_14371:484-1212(+)